MTHIGANMKGKCCEAHLKHHRWLISWSAGNQLHPCGLFFNPCSRSNEGGAAPHARSSGLESLDTVRSKTRPPSREIRRVLSGRTWREIVLSRAARSGFFSVRHCRDEGGGGWSVKASRRCQSLMTMKMMKRSFSNEPRRSRQIPNTPNPSLSVRELISFYWLITFSPQIWFHNQIQPVINSFKYCLSAKN